MSFLDMLIPLSEHPRPPFSRGLVSNIGEALEDHATVTDAAEETAERLNYIIALASFHDRWRQGFS